MRRGPRCASCAHFGLPGRSCFDIWVRIRQSLLVRVLSLSFAAVAVAFCLRCVPRGQRAPLGADTYVLIDWSTRLVEPSLLFHACAALHVRRRVHGRRSRLSVGEALSYRLSCLSKLLAPSCCVVDDCCEHPFAQSALRCSLFSKCSRSSLVNGSCPR